MYVEMAALLSSWMWWPRPSLPAWRWMSGLLLGVVAVEWVGRYYAVTEGNNIWLYNWTVPAEYTAWSVFVSAQYRLRPFRPVGYTLAVLFALGATVRLATQDTSTWSSWPMLAGSGLTIMLTLMAFYDLYQDEELVHIARVPRFWLATGLLVFTTGQFVYLLLADVLETYHLDESGIWYKTLIDIPVIALYSSITIGYLCTRYSTSRQT